MDTVNSIKGQTQKPFVFIGITVAVLLSIFVSSVDAVAVHSLKYNSPSPAFSLRTVCNVTLYPAACFSSISKLPLSNSTDPVVLFRLSLKVVADELNSILDLPRKLAEGTVDKNIKSSLHVCTEMFVEAIDRVNETVSIIDIGKGKNILNRSKINDLLTWLSAAVTDHDTCIEALDETEFGSSTISRDLKSAMANSIQFTGNSLSIVAKILAPLFPNI